MALRKFPYGYKMEGGTLKISSQEAEIIRNIFKKRADGKSIYAIAKELYETQTDYFSENVKKASCKVNSVLYDERYIGAENYPVIVDKDLFQKVQKMKGQQFCSPKIKTVPKEKVYIPEMTVYVPNTAVFEKEAELKKMLKENIEDAENIRQAIFELASEKYNCII